MLVGRDDEDALRRRRSSPPRSGSRNLGGYLAGGMTSWREEKRRDRARSSASTSRTLHERARRALQVLDVRERAEWDAGHIPGSVHTPYHDIDGIPDGIDPARPIAVICSSGQRSAVGGHPAARATARGR